jgi:hypothetical protein
VKNTQILHSVEMMYPADEQHCFMQTTKRFYRAQQGMHPVPLKTL